MVYTLVFDYENRLTEVKQGTTVLASFVYDADGNRVKSTVGGVTTVYIAGLYEYSGGAARSYYTGPGGVVAMRSGGVVYYLLSDQLNSTARIVNSAGVIQADTYYYPYGSKRSGSYSSLTTKCCSDAAAIRVGRRVVSSRCALTCPLRARHRATRDPAHRCVASLPSRKLKRRIVQKLVQNLNTKPLDITPPVVN